MNVFFSLFIMTTYFPSCVLTFGTLIWLASYRQYGGGEKPHSEPIWQESGAPSLKNSGDLLDIFLPSIKGLRPSKWLQIWSLAGICMTWTKTGEQRAHFLNSKPCFHIELIFRRFTCKSEEKRATMKLLWVVMLVVGTAFADDDDKKENVGTVVGIDLGTTYSW